MYMYIFAIPLGIYFALMELVLHSGLVPEKQVTMYSLTKALPRRLLPRQTKECIHRQHHNATVVEETLLLYCDQDLKNTTFTNSVHMHA